MVGLVRIELTTSPLSGVRSSQLSYRPDFVQRAPQQSCSALAVRSRDTALAPAHPNQPLTYLHLAGTSEP